MRQRWAAVAGLLALGGCASLGEQIQHQQEIIQRCDAIKDSPQLPDWKVGERYLLERAGAYANCTLQHDLLGKGKKTQWKALCELDEILQRHNLATSDNAQPADSSPPPCSPADAKTSASKTSTANDLKKAIHDLQASYKCLNIILETVQYCIFPKHGKLTSSPQTCIDDNAATVIWAAGDTTRHLAQVHKQAKQQTAAAAADLQLWALTSQSSLQKLLSAETLADDFIVNLAQNHAMTFVAERSYRQLKRTVASADKRIDRLDEKAYGALTVGNWFFTPKLQQAIAESIPPQLATADKRNDNTLKASAVFRHELARAACNNIATSNETGMLQALLDGAFVATWDASINQHNPILRPTAHAQGRTGMNPVRETTAPASIVTSRVQTAPSGACNVGSDVHKIYAAYEWQTRRQLLEIQLSEANRSRPRPQGNGQSENAETLPQLPRESDVRKLAKDAAARSISPGYLNQLAQIDQNRPSTFTLSADSLAAYTVDIRQNVQAAWVEQTMVINSQISNDNHNANTIIVNPPPVTSPTPTPTPTPAPDLCPAIRAQGLMCTQLGNSWQITPPPNQRFQTFAASDKTLETLFTKAGIAAATFAAQNNKTLFAQIDGYASLKSAEHLCTAQGNTLKSAAYVFRYSDRGQINGIQYKHHTPSATPITASIDCRNKAHQHGNLLLSAARAMWTAHLMEQNAQGAIVIDSIQPHGNQLANSSSVSDNPGDRTVAITLQMR